MNLKIEDVKVGDELDCIDRDGFNNSHRHNNTLTEFKVCKVGDLGVCINDGDWIIEIEELKYFKKKEQSQYTFDDLIDVITQAFKCGFIIDYYVIDSGVDICVNEDEFRWKFRKHRDDIESFINKIKSLYKETFVIGSEEDIAKVKKDADIGLVNGMKVKSYENAYRFNEGWKVACADGKRSGALDLFALKGATVEQERGSDD